MGIKDETNHKLSNAELFSEMKLDWLDAMYRHFGALSEEYMNALSVMPSAHAADEAMRIINVIGALEADQGIPNDETFTVDIISGATQHAYECAIINVAKVLGVDAEALDDFVVNNTDSSYPHTPLKNSKLDKFLRKCSGISMMDEMENAIVDFNKGDVK